MTPAPEANSLSTVSPATSADSSTTRPSWIGQSLAAVGALVSALYLANIGVGIFELSPDNLPGIGNIDEFLFSLLLIYCLQKLGVNLLPILRPRASGPRDVIAR
jgi:hypothetical protein